MHYLLHYELIDKFLEKRVPFRTEHLERVRRAHDGGNLVLAGALSDPADAALLVFRGDSPAAAEDFVASDPYVLNGLVKSWRIRKWMTVIGDDAAFF